MKLMTRPKQPIPIARQVAVLFRDKWLCHWCGRPVIFAPALKYLEAFVGASGYELPLAYYNKNYRRDASPLLDELGLAMDHVKAHAKGGSDDESNLVTACSRCNARKSDKEASDYVKEHPKWAVKSKHGEPTHWDGLASYFVAAARANPGLLTTQERKWLLALEGHIKAEGRAG